MMYYKINYDFHYFVKDFIFISKQLPKILIKNDLSNIYI